MPSYSNEEREECRTAHISQKRNIENRGEISLTATTLEKPNTTPLVLALVLSRIKMKICVGFFSVSLLFELLLELLYFTKSYTFPHKLIEIKMTSMHGQERVY